MSTPTLTIIVTRDVFSPTWTLSRVDLDLPGDNLGPLPFGYALEDLDRHVELDPSRKVPGQTCIPTGVFRVETTWSPRFERMCPQVMDVPWFRGIRLHPGSDSGDTEGCVLIGLARDVQAGTISRSRPACAWLEAEISRVEAAGGQVTLEVRRA